MTYDYLQCPGNGKQLSIAMACDFFYPNVGGVETHIYALSQCLIARGHRVIVITHGYGPKGRQRQGIRYMAQGLKVYYIPFAPMYRETILMTIYGTLPIIREILIREQIDVLHGHSSFSCLGSEAILHAQGLSIPTILTDHSLFGFADFTAVFMNKILQGILGLIDYVICVSHTGKENTVLRAHFNPEQVYVIPNAIDVSSFVPDPSARDLRYVTITVICRLTYRKGVDLLVAIIPALCALYPQVRFLIGGDGPKRLDLEEMRERHELHSRVKLIGSLRPREVRDVLVQGDIFLNTSLTEAFCMALLEAVSCGLLVVSTAVGGVPEVLPSEFIRLAPARASELAKCVSSAVQEVIDQRQRSGVTAVPVDSNNQTLSVSMDCGTESLNDKIWRMHNWARESYSWPKVAERTEAVYFAAVSRQRADFVSLLDRYCKQIGGAYSTTLCVLAYIHRFLLYLASWFRPEHTIGRVPYLHVDKTSLRLDETDTSDSHWFTYIDE